MPIVANRKTGKILHMPDYTQEQRDRAWEAVVTSWAKTHQAELRRLAVESEAAAHADGGDQ